MSNVHVWAPDLFSTGGIQAFSRHFIAALNGIARSDEIRVLLKNDLPRVVQRRGDFDRAMTFGHWPSILRTTRFTSECAARGWHERPRFIASLHLNFGPVAQLLKELIKVPYVVVAHGIDTWRLQEGARTKALHKADLVLAVSHYTRDWLVQKLGLDAERVQILPNTFLPQRFSIGGKSPKLLQRYGLTPRTRVILTVCRLAGAERYKGYDQMIRALPQILQHVPDTRYLLVGTGPDRLRIEKLVAELNLRDAVIFGGHVSDDELAEHYNLCDLFAMPSKAEGFGIVYLEALACGKPVLAGNRDGSRDALANGDLGLLVDPDDTAEIALETIRVLQRQHTHPKLFHPELLRESAKELFGFDVFKRKLKEKLGRFMENDGGQRTADHRPRTADH
jgi:glycosyltransferase involved in cell wall biosynthesis